MYRLREQVKEVVGLRDRCIGSVMYQSEYEDIVLFLCTEYRGGIMEYLIYILYNYMNKEFQTEHSFTTLQ